MVDTVSLTDVFRPFDHRKHSAARCVCIVGRAEFALVAHVLCGSLQERFGCRRCCVGRLGVNGLLCVPALRSIYIINHAPQLSNRKAASTWYGSTNFIFLPLPGG